MSTHARPNNPGQATPHTTRQFVPPLLPSALEGVALVDAKTSAAVGAMSLSWWHDKVAAGIAPQPVIRSTRCTRWRAEDVAGFWRDFGAQGSADAADALTARAAKASAAARAKRRDRLAVATQVGA